MASPVIEHPSAAHGSQSFRRYESASPSPNDFARSRANTQQNGTTSHRIMVETLSSPLDEPDGVANNDIFEKSSLISGSQGFPKDVTEVESPNDVPEGFDELPVELISLVDRFIESLTAKVYNTPPSVEKLSAIFQDFYTQSESHIATHINALSSRQSRGTSPSASISSRSPQPRQSHRSSTIDTLGSPGGGAPQQQMLTPQEISDRRKARRLLDRKGLALEDAVEKRVCERVYSRIWRHRSTLDEVRDEKLRSRTAALALVGIGMRDLGIEIGSSKTHLNNGPDIEDWIARARDGLLRMNDAKYPFGKLQQLAAAHKNIVDLLTALHQGSSSADEILPTLIYTLITTPQEGINVISNLHFIQRFRASSKVDGEAAYCLTNLEAAITFLETVDLASLRSDESLEGPSPSKLSNSRPATTKSAEILAPTPGAPKPAITSRSSYSTVPITSKDKPTATTPPAESLDSVSASAVSPHQSSPQGRISTLLQPPATAIGAAGDAVRNTADQGIRSIGSALDNSFKVLFGRLGEQKVAADSNDTVQPIIVPKTLDDARKLVDPKLPEDDDSLSTASSVAERPENQFSSSLIADDRHQSALADRKQLRDRSVESITPHKPTQQAPTNAGNVAVESMRSLGHTLNPLKGFGGMSVMRGFGRSSSSTTPVSTLTGAASNEKPVGDQERSSSPIKAPATDIKTLPPIQRFMDISDAQELRLGEVSDLLRDYKRLANALHILGAF